MTTTQTYTEETTSVTGLSVRVLRGGQGPSLVWLHHSTGSVGWLPVHEKLSENFTVIVPDLPGFGQSDRPVWARHPRDLALLMNRVIDKLDLGPVTLVGGGLGGWIAAEMATMNDTALSSLVLIGAAGVQPDEGEIMDLIMFDFEEYVKNGFSSDDAFTAIFGEEIESDLTTLWDFSREMTARITWKPWMFSRQLVPILAEMETPTLLIWGELDRVVPVNCGELYQKHLANARLDVVGGAGHLVELEQPDETAAKITEFASG